MEFKGCKYLMYDENQFEGELVKIGSHVTWERKNPLGGVELCQNCEKRGRLNQYNACIGEDKALCGEYDEVVIKL